MKSSDLRKPPYRFHAQDMIGGYKKMLARNMNTSYGSSLVLSAMLPVMISPTITHVGK